MAIYHEIENKLKLKQKLLSMTIAIKNESLIHNYHIINKLKAQELQLVKFAVKQNGLKQ